MEGFYVAIGIIAILVFIASRCVVIVQQSKAFVVERLGKFYKVMSVGSSHLHRFNSLVLNNYV